MGFRTKQRPDDDIASYLRDVQRHQRITPQEEIRLGRLARDGDAGARARLAEANLRLVISIAMRYAKRAWSLPLSDLIGEGNVGLMHAVDRWDPERGFRFSTYATWWIQQKIRRALEEGSRMVRIPVYAHQIIRDDEMGRPVMLNGGLTIEWLRQAFQREELSIDSMVDARGERGPGFVDELGCDPDTASREQIEAAEDLEVLARRLTQRELDVLRAHLGIGREEETLAEIGQRLRVSRERVRQIEIEAIEKMRVSSRWLAVGRSAQ